MKELQEQQIQYEKEIVARLEANMMNISND